MPGPVSDSYDPEFGTRENCEIIIEAIDKVIQKFNSLLNSERQYILNVVNGFDGKTVKVLLNEKELRIIRFCLHRTIDTI